MTRDQECRGRLRAALRAALMVLEARGADSQRLVANGETIGEIIKDAINYDLRCGTHPAPMPNNPVDSRQ